MSTLKPIDRRVNDPPRICPDQEPEVLRLYRKAALRLLEKQGEEDFLRRIKENGNHIALSRLKRSLKLIKKSNKG